jgi:gas vesicle protein
MNNTSKIFTAFAIGATAGIIAGILFAPDKGSETRKKIKGQGKRIVDDLKDKIEDAKQACQRGNEKFEEAL